MSPKIATLLGGLTPSGLQSYWRLHFINKVHYLNITDTFMRTRDSYLSGNKTDLFTSKVYELASQGYGKLQSSINTEQYRRNKDLENCIRQLKLNKQESTRTNCFTNGQISFFMSNSNVKQTYLLVFNACVLLIEAVYCKLQIRTRAMQVTAVFVDL